MDVLIDFQKLALSLATAVFHFHRKTSNLSEYSAKDICDTLIKGSSTRSSSFVLVESDLEAAFGNITLRKILKAIFPGQISFARSSRRAPAIVNYYKILFSSLDIGLFTVESLREAIMALLPRAAQDNNNDEKEDEKADGMMQYVIIKLRQTLCNCIRYSIL